MKGRLIIAKFNGTCRVCGKQTHKIGRQGLIPLAPLRLASPRG